MQRFVAGWVMVGMLVAAPRIGRADPEAAVDLEAARHRRVRLALSVGGVGVALFTVSGAFGLAAHNAWQRVVADCGGTPERCPEPALAAARFDRDHANRSAHRADLFAALGGAAVITAAVLYFTAPDAPASRQALQVAPAIGGDGVGLVVSGVLR